MSAAPDQPLDLIVCPDCGAAVVAGDKLCWLCSRPMEPVAASSRAALPPADLVRRGRAGDVTFAVLMVLTVAAVALVCVGAAMDEPGIGIGIAVLAAPALLAVLVGWLKARGRGRPLGPSDVLARFALSFAVVIGAVAALFVAAVVALFAFCIYLLSSGNI